MKYFIQFVTLLFLIFNFHHAAAQGCSDAGICNIRSFRPAATVDKDFNNFLSVGLSVGAADHSIMVGGAQLSYSRRLGGRFNTDLRVTYFLHSGNEISVSGPGDVYANINYRLSPQWTLTAGAKIPLSDGGKFYTGTMPLPMDYQSSLGTLDLIGGVGYRSTKWQFVLAYQHPLLQNGNWFEPQDWPQDSPLREIQRTFEFVRKPDLMARISYPVELHDKLTITPSLLPIYHLGDDTYTGIDGYSHTIVGSEGLTINANVFFDIKMSTKSNLTIGAGFPLLVRDVRPDGLTRGVVFGVDYGFAF